MKNLMIILAMFFALSTTSVYSQSSRNSKPHTVALVTKSMADKIADFCLSGQGYGKAVFYEANSKYLSFSDIANGKGNEVLNSLSKYPKYSENFIRKVYNTWGYNGLKEVGFNDKEIVVCKKIINKTKSE